MKKQLNFTCPPNLLNVNNTIIDYFALNHFRLTSEENDVLFFTGGNSTLNFIAFNPLKWSSQIVVVMKGKEVYVYASIITFPHWVTKRNESTWNVFLFNLKVLVVNKFKTEVVQLRMPL